MKRDRECKLGHVCYASSNHDNKSNKGSICNGSLS